LCRCLPTPEPTLRSFAGAPRVGIRSTGRSLRGKDTGATIPRQHSGPGPNRIHLCAVDDPVCAHHTAFKRRGIRAHVIVVPRKRSADDRGQRHDRVDTPKLPAATVNSDALQEGPTEW
jgi:hypothetical protein